MARLVQKVEQGGQILSVTMIPGPKPDNFGSLGIPRHPPGAGRFELDEPPYWDTDNLTRSLRRLLSLVSKRATIGATFRISYRPGKRLPDGTIEYEASQNLAFYSKKFAMALENFPTHVVRSGPRKGDIVPNTPIQAARAFAHEFALFWNFDDSIQEGYKVGGYIYSIGAALFMNKHRYSEGHISSVEWAKRYNRARGKTRKPRRKPGRGR